MLFDGLLIEHQCRPQAVAAAGTSGTIVYRNLFLSSLLGRPIQCFPVLIWPDERIGELAPINVQSAPSGSGIHDRGTPGISYA